LLALPSSLALLPFLPSSLALPLPLLTLLLRPLRSSRLADAGQLKNLRCGNRRVTRAKRKNFAAQQSTDRALAKENRGAAIGVLRWPKEKSSTVIDGLRRQKEKSRCGNR
jgi:hypothetical protein